MNGGTYSEGIDEIQEELEELNNQDICNLEHCRDLLDDAKEIDSNVARLLAAEYVGAEAVEYVNDQELKREGISSVPKQYSSDV